jgi:hypothetical protein
VKTSECRWILDTWHAKNDEFSARLIPFDNPAYRATQIKQDVESGKSKIVNLFRGNEHLGFLTYEIADDELLVVALYIDPDLDKALDAAIPFIDSLAKSNHCKSVRFHTARPGLVVGCAKNGFKMSEIVMRKFYD